MFLSRAYSDISQSTTITPTQQNAAVQTDTYCITGDSAQHIKKQNLSGAAPPLRRKRTKSMSILVNGVSGVHSSVQSVASEADADKFRDFWKSRDMRGVRYEQFYTNDFDFLGPVLVSTSVFVLCLIVAKKLLQRTPQVQCDENGLPLGW